VKESGNNERKRNIPKLNFCFQIQVIRSKDKKIRSLIRGDLSRNMFFNAKQKQSKSILSRWEGRQAQEGAGPGVPGPQRTWGIRED
jgi:hypothetical protein